MPYESKKEEKRCACLGQTLDKFIQPIMLSVLAQGPATGYAVIKKMRDYATFSDGGPDPTGAYRYLKTLENRGLIQKEKTEGREQYGQNDVSLYHITENGRACLESWVDTLRDYAQTLQILAAQVEERPGEKMA